MSQFITGYVEFIIMFSDETLNVSRFFVLLLGAPSVKGFSLGLIFDRIYYRIDFTISRGAT